MLKLHNSDELSSVFYSFSKGKPSVCEECGEDKDECVCEYEEELEEEDYDNDDFEDDEEEDYEDDDFEDDEDYEEED